MKFPISQFSPFSTPHFFQKFLLQKIQKKYPPFPPTHLTNTLEFEPFPQKTSPKTPSVFPRFFRFFPVFSFFEKNTIFSRNFRVLTKIPKKITTFLISWKYASQVRAKRNPCFFFSKKTPIFRTFLKNHKILSEISHFFHFFEKTHFFLIFFSSLLFPDSKCWNSH